MMRVPRFPAVIWAAVLVCLLCVPSAAEEGLSGPHAFDDGIQAARAALEEGDCEEAIQALTALLEAHKGRNYVKGRRIEIQELMRHLACGAQFKLPKAKDVVSGKLSSWSPKTGKIRIVYTPKTRQDFEKRDGLLYLPARLIGPFTLEVKGKAYPADQKQPPRAVLGGDQDPDTGKIQTWRVDFGVPARNPRAASPVPPSFVHSDGGAEQQLNKKKKAPGKLAKKFKLVLKATKTRITAKVGSSTLGVAKKHEGVYGYLGFHAGGWDEVKLTAVIDPSWIEGMVEEILLTRLEEFDKTYDPTQYIPGWLSDPITKRQDGPRAKTVDPIGKLPEKFTDDLQEAYNEIRLDEFENALKRIDKMQANGASEAACEYLRAEARLAMVQPEKALDHVKRAIEVEPAYLDAVVMQGEVLRRLGRFSEALAAFEQLASVHAGSPGAYEAGATALLLAGRPGDAKRITQLAARNGVTSEELIKLNSALGKVVHGPRWKKRYRHKSQNYEVSSDLDQTTCVEAANLLEEAFQAFRNRFAWVERDRTRLFRVFIFKDRPGFMAYQGDLSEFMGKPSEMAAGLYSPLLKQLLIWNHADRTEVLNTVRHEGFHQYLDRVMPDPPTWFNEGLAVYHENGINIDGKLTFGQMHPHYLRLLSGRGLQPLDRFLYISPHKFYEENAHSNYGQAWLLVHMLQHSTKEYMALFKAYLEDLKTGSAYIVTRKHFPKESLAKIDADLKRYLDELD